MRVTLRPIGDGDAPFLEAVYASTREKELAQIPWDDASRSAFLKQQFAAQDARYRGNYPGATVDVVEVDGERAGRLYVHRGARDIRIMEIALLAPVRGHGVGTALIGALIDEAEGSARKLSIYVEVNNPARTLYERLAFQPVGEHGVHVLMERAPSRG